MCELMVIFGCFNGKNSIDFYKRLTIIQFVLLLKNQKIKLLARRPLKNKGKNCLIDKSYSNNPVFYGGYFILP